MQLIYNAPEQLERHVANRFFALLSGAHDAAQVTVVGGLDVEYYRKT